MKCTVEKIVHGGYGLVRIAGAAILVPYGVPGDLIDIEYDHDNPSFGWIRGIIRPSPHRRASDCPVFGLCGGCFFDMMTYPREIEAKRSILLEDLARVGGMRDVELDRIVPSPSPYHYRNNAQLKVDGEGRIGFFMRKSHQVVPLPPKGCLLLAEPINGFIEEIRETVHLRRGGVRVRCSGRDVASRGISGRPDDPVITHRARGLSFRVGIDAFFQVNDRVIDPWLGLIEEYLEPGARDGVLDLYCGSGLISLAVAGRCRSVLGIELSGSAVDDARYNARLNGIRNVEFARADLARGIPGSFPGGEGADRIVVDPPRAGLGRTLVDFLVRRRPRSLVYASCSTATFARDAALLVSGGLSLGRLSMVDMFPRTRHVEVVALFTDG